MKQLPVLLLFLLLLATACNKNKCIHGTVTDSKTGLPIVGARVELTYEFSVRANYRTRFESEETNDAGEFSHETEEKNSEGIRVSGVFKAGYSPVIAFEGKDHKGCNEVAIKLTPLDGTLKLVVSNETGSVDSVFARVLNKYEYDAHNFYLGSSPTRPFPLVLAPDEVFKQSFGTIVNDSSYVMWKFTKDGPWLHTDSFLVKNADTLLFNIDY